VVVKELRPSEVKDVVRRHEQGQSYREIAEHYGVPYSTVQHIVKIDKRRARR
jgi:DNA-directed RNA polymerase specialized sigma24 family protein